MDMDENSVRVLNEKLAITRELILHLDMIKEVADLRMSKEQQEYLKLSENGLKFLKSVADSEKNQHDNLQRIHVKAQAQANYIYTQANSIHNVGNPVALEATYDSILGQISDFNWIENVWTKIQDPVRLREWQELKRQIELNNAAQRRGTQSNVNAQSWSSDASRQVPVTAAAGSSTQGSSINTSDFQQYARTSASSSQRAYTYNQFSDIGSGGMTIAPGPSTQQQEQLRGYPITNYGNLNVQQSTQPLELLHQMLPPPPPPPQPQPNTRFR